MVFVLRRGDHFGACVPIFEPSSAPTTESDVPKQTDKLRAKADEYEKLADAAVDPEEKKRLKGLAKAARNIAPPRGDPA